MIARIAMILAACFAVAACSQPTIECNTDGMVIIPADASAETRQDLEKRNRDLLFRRYDKVVGRAEWQTPESLAKAEGCP